jgi:pimeloyl-ACP methyl ester carboxylesterase
MQDLELCVVDEGRGDPVLLVHGFPLDHTMWSGQIAGLSADVRLIAPDLPGFGHSNVSPGTRTMAQMADDLAGLLDALAIDQAVTVCGLSMGGYIAWEFWRRHARRLRRLILCDTRAVADPPEVARGREVLAEQVIQRGARIVADEMLPRLFAPTTATLQPQLIEATRSVIQATDPAGIAAAARGMARRSDFTPLLPKMAIPALVLCGQFDCISTPAEMQRIAGAMPQAEYLEIAGAGHMAPLEKPHEVNSAILRFLGPG